MTRLAWFAAVSCLILAAACTQQPAPPPQSPASATPTASEATAPAAKPATAQALAAAAAPAEVVNAGEDLETVDADAAPATAESPLLTAALAAAPPAAVPGSWKENENYLKLVPTQPTVGNLKSGRIEVAEVFWYGCGHCYVLDPRVESWRKKGKPAYVDFVRVPAMWNAGVKLHAQLFYAVEALGKLEAMHPAIFSEIHQNHELLIDSAADPAKSEQMQAAFAAKFGISADAYSKAFNSFGVDQKLRRAEQLNRAYMITGVPTFVINGKYWTDVGHAGSEEKLIDLINDLAAMEKAGR